VDAGRVRAPNFTTYLVPTVEDTIRPTIAPFMRTREPSGPFGAKGAGELSTVAIPAAICNAIHNAVGGRVKELPATPERVLEAVRI